LRKILDDWQQCKKEQQIEVKEVELPVVSKAYQYAGRLDLIATVRGVPCLIDIKTRKYNHTCDTLQTAAYVQAYNESYKPNPKIKHRYFLQLKFDEEGYRFFEIEKNSSHLHYFLSALAIQKWKEISKND